MKFAQSAGYGPVGVNAGQRRRITVTLDAIQATIGHLARRRIRPVGTLAGVDAVRIQRSTLRGLRRCGMIEETAMLVIGYEDNRIAPVRTVAHRGDRLRDERLAFADVAVGSVMFIVLLRRD